MEAPGVNHTSIVFRVYAAVGRFIKDPGFLQLVISCVVHS